MENKARRTSFRKHWLDVEELRIQLRAGRLGFGTIVRALALTATVDTRARRCRLLVGIVLFCLIMLCRSA